MRWLVLCGAIIAAAAALADEGTPTREHKTLAIPCLTRPITVDGELADWPQAAQLAVMALDPEADQYRGTARAAWDEQYLYVAFEVASGKGMRNAGDDPATAYKTGDTVEVFLSVSHDPLANRVPRGPAMDTAKDGDYRILMTQLRNTKPVVFGYDFVHEGAKDSPFSLAISGPQASADRTGLVPNAQLVVRDAEINGLRGFAAEARLPWAYFRGYQPRPGARLLFNLATNFSNQAGTANIGKAYWNGPGHMTNDAEIEAQIHPEDWGWLELLAPAPPANSPNKP